MTSRPQAACQSSLDTGLRMETAQYCLKFVRGPTDDLLFSLQFQAMLRVYGHISKPFIRAIASGGLTGEFHYRTRFETASALEMIGSGFLGGKDGRSIELVVDDLRHPLTSEGDIAAAIEMLRTQEP